MGGVGDFLFGKPSEQQSTSSGSSGNYAYPAVAGAVAPTLGYISQGGSMLGSLLGLNNVAPTTGGSTPAPSTSTTPVGGGGDGDLSEKPGIRRIQAQKRAETAQSTPLPVQQFSYSPQNQQDALNAFSNSTGMDFLRSQGIKALEGSQAGRGMLQSGATGTKLVQFGQDLGKTYLNQYLDRLLDYSKLGLAGANAMTAAGGWSKSTGQSDGSGSKSGALPAMISSVASIPGISDIRLKKNVVRVGATSLGIPVYDFDFVEMAGLPKGRQRGVMAHEVRELQPYPFVRDMWNGFHGVDYAKVGSFA